MACCLTAPIHYLNQCWSRPMSPYVVTRPQWVNDSIIQCMQQWFPRHQLQLTQLVNGACYPSDHPETTTMCTWWRHQMETFSALLAICAENSPVTGKFPAQRPVTRSFDVFFHLRLNKRLSKLRWGWWYETQSRPLWRHWNETPLSYKLGTSRWNLRDAYPICECVPIPQV